MHASVNALPPAPRPPSRVAFGVVRRGVYAIALVLPLALAVVAAFHLGGSRARELGERDRRVALLAHSFDQSASRILAVADGALVGAMAAVQAGGGLNALDEAALRALMQSALPALDRTSSMIAIGGDGRLRAASEPSAARGLDLADRPYFRHHRATADTRPFVGEVVRSRITGRNVITLTRALRGPRGFEGVMGIAVDVTAFTGFYEDASAQEPGAFLLLARLADGTVVAGHGVPATLVGERIDALQGYAAALGAEDGGFDAARPGTAAPAHLAFRASPALGLVAIAGEEHATALARWREEAMAIGLMWALLAASTALLGLIALRKLREVEAAAAALAEQSRRRAEADSRAHAYEAMLDDAIESLPNPFVIYDAEDRLAKWNRSFAERYAWLADEPDPKGLTFEAFCRRELARRRTVDPALDADPEGWLARRIASHRNASGEVIERVLRDGRTMHITEHRTSAGGTVGVMVDVTALKEAERRARQSERRFRELLELSADGYWIQDEHYRFVHVSGALFEGPALGDFAARAIGRALWELEDGLPLAGAWERHRDAVSRRETFRDLTVAFAVAGGTRYILLSGEPRFDEDGAFRGYKGVAKDATARIVAEQALRDSEAKYRLLVEEAQVVSWEFDFERNALSYVSPQIETMLGYPLASWLEPGFWAERIHPDDRERVIGHFMREAREGRPHRIDYRMVARDARVVWIEDVIALRKDASGRLAGLRGILIDVTERKGAEERLRESEARFRSLIELSYDWYWEQDEQFRFVGFAGLAAGVGSIPTTSRIGKTRWECDDIRPLSCSFAEHRATLERHLPFRDFEYELVGENGARRYLAVAGLPRFDEQGNFRGYRGTGRDITARKRAEQALSESEARYRSILNSMREGVILRDRENRIVACNLSAERLFGLPAAAIVGSAALAPPLAMVGEDGKEIPIEERPGRYALRTGAPVTDRVYGIRRPDGTEVWVSVNAQPIADAEGVPPRGVVVTYDDITEQRRAQRALAAVQAHNDMLVRALQRTADAVIELDLDGCVRAWSAGAQSLFGHAADYAVGRTLQELALAGFGRGRAEIALARIASGIAHRFESEYRTAAGARVWALVEITPLLDDDGRHVGAMCICRDITALKLAQAEIEGLNRDLERRVAQRTADLVAANRELESFCYSVSHDLRAPLRAIEGFGALLAERVAGTLDAESQRYVARMRAGAMRMAALIDDLLKLSRVTRSEFSRQRVDLSEMAAAILADLASRDPGRAVAVAVAPGLVAEADQGLVRVLLENLIGNAWKFTGRTARASIAVARVSDVEPPVYVVRDNGAGFDAAYADKLFGPFQRLHHERDFPGLGIGLATAQRVVARHGGRIWARGKVDAGAAFYFTLEPGLEALPEEVAAAGAFEPMAVSG